jgi:MFS family permease
MIALASSIHLQATQVGLGTKATLPAVGTAGILGAIIGGVLKLPIAKTLNLWGRAEAWFLFLGVYVLGIILMATFDGTAGYSAGYTLYWIGYDAIYLICDIFIADTSGLRNRAFGFAFINTPFIITAFVGPYAAQSFITNAGWRWAVGAFAIIQVVVIAPLGILFKFYEKKAKKMGLFESRVSGRSTLQSIAHYFHEFDVVGAILIMAAFVLFLLPFSLQTSARVTYGSSAFIAMIVVGLLLFPIFAVWEKFFARTHFIRWELFRQRTIVGAVMVAIAIQFSFYCWELYFNQFLQIVYGLSISNAGYMLQIYNVGSCFWGVVFGLWVRYSRHVKYESLCFGLPLAFLGAGLTIYFRGQDGGNDVGFIVMTQIFIAFGGGTLVIAHQVATMAACDREGVPMALALLGMFSSVGQAIGAAVIAAIYAKVYPEAAASKLPAGSEAVISELYLGGAVKTLTFAVGTPERTAANYAMQQVQKWGGVAATCVLIMAIPGIALWKNYKLDKKQNKGTVF